MRTNLHLLATLALSLAIILPVRASDTGQNALIASGFIYEKAPYPECHASTLAELPNGQIAAAWFGGTKERNPDVCIYFSRLEKNGAWTTPVQVADGIQSDGAKRLPTWNPVLFQAPNSGPLILFYKVGPSPSTWWGMRITSLDGGRTWSKPERLPDGILGPIKNKPVVLPDGAWISPSSTEGNKDGWLVHFEISRDQGKTWEKIGPVKKGSGLDAIQPSVLIHKNGSLEALCRTKQGVVAMTWSEDNGRTWTALAATELPNPNSGTDAVTLADGRQLIIYNPSAHRIKEPTKGNRYPIAAAISEDGLAWKRIQTFDTIPCASGYAYPAVIQTRDGLVHITYTFNRQKIKHIILDPKKL